MPQHILPTIDHRFSNHARTKGLAALLLVLSLLAGLLPGSAWAGDADRPLEVRTMGSCQDEEGLGLLTFGLGTDQLTGGSFNVSGIPDGATVVNAWLYWNGADDGNNVNDDPSTFDPNVDDGDPTITLDGNQVPAPQRIGGPANWVGIMNVYAYAYRSDVTSIVTGNGVYVADGMDDFFSGALGYNNGMELVVVYQQPGQAPALVGIGEGLDLAHGTGGPNVGPGTLAALFEFSPVFSKRAATLSVFVGGAGTNNGASTLWYKTGVQPPVERQNFRIAGTPGAISVQNPFTGKNNQNGEGYWDSVKTSIIVPAGSTWVAVQVQSENGAELANLEWVGATLEMSLSCGQRVFTPVLRR